MKDNDNFSVLFLNSKKYSTQAKNTFLATISTFATRKYIKKYHIKISINSDLISTEQADFLKHQQQCRDSAF